jgi:hypothetical protein
MSMAGTSFSLGPLEHDPPLLAPMREACLWPDILGTWLENREANPATSTAPSSMVTKLFRAPSEDLRIKIKQLGATKKTNKTKSSATRTRRGTSSHLRTVRRDYSSRRTLTSHRGHKRRSLHPVSSDRTNHRWRSGFYRKRHLVENIL